VPEPLLQALVDQELLSQHQIQQMLDENEGKYEGSQLQEMLNQLIERLVEEGYLKLHEEPQVPNYGKRGSGPKLKAGMTLAIEPMINSGTASVRLRDDGWTVCTADGMPSAHFEHTILITKNEPEILTWRGKTQLK